MRKIHLLVGVAAVVLCVKTGFAATCSPNYNYSDEEGNVIRYLNCSDVHLSNLMYSGLNTSNQVLFSFEYFDGIIDSIVPQIGDQKHILRLSHSNLLVHKYDMNSMTATSFLEIDNSSFFKVENRDQDEFSVNNVIVQGNSKFEFLVPLTTMFNVNHIDNLVIEEGSSFSIEDSPLSIDRSLDVDGDLYIISSNERSGIQANFNSKQNNLHNIHLQSALSSECASCSAVLYLELDSDVDNNADHVSIDNLYMTNDIYMQIDGTSGALELDDDSLNIVTIEHAEILNDDDNQSILVKKAVLDIAGDGEISEIQLGEESELRYTNQEKGTAFTTTVVDSGSAGNVNVKVDAQGDFNLHDSNIDNLTVTNGHIYTQSSNIGNLVLNGGSYTNYEDGISTINKLNITGQDTVYIYNSDILGAETIDDVGNISMNIDNTNLAMSDGGHFVFEGVDRIVDGESKDVTLNINAVDIMGTNNNDGGTNNDGGVIDVNYSVAKLNITNSKIMTVNINANDAGGRQIITLDDIEDSNSNVLKNEIENLNFNFDNGSYKLDGATVEHIRLTNGGRVTLSTTEFEDLILNGSDANLELQSVDGSIIHVNQGRSLKVDAESQIDTIDINTTNSNTSIDIMSGSHVKLINFNEDGTLSIADSDTIVDKIVVDKQLKEDDTIELLGGTVTELELQSNINLDISETSETQIGNLNITGDNMVFEAPEYVVITTLTLNNSTSVVNVGSTDTIANVANLGIEQGVVNYDYNQDYTLQSVIDSSPQKVVDDNSASIFNVNAYNSTLTIKELNVDQLTLISGEISLTSDSVINQALAIHVDDNDIWNKGDNLGDFHTGIYTTGNINLPSHIDVFLESSDNITIYNDNTFELLYSEGQINHVGNFEGIADNLPDWFTIKSYTQTDDNGEALLLNVSRQYSYGDFYKEVHKADEYGLDNLVVLDSIINDPSKDMPEHLKPIIHGLDNNSGDNGELLAGNAQAMYPINNTVYVMSMQTKLQNLLSANKNQLDYDLLEKRWWFNTSSNIKHFDTHETLVKEHQENTTMLSGGYDFKSNDNENVQYTLSGGLTFGSLDDKDRIYSLDTQSLVLMASRVQHFKEKHSIETSFGYQYGHYDYNRTLGFIDDLPETSANEQVVDGGMGGYQFLLDITYSYLVVDYNDWKVENEVEYTGSFFYNNTNNENGYGKLDIESSMSASNDILFGGNITKAFLLPKDNVLIQPNFDFLIGFRKYNIADTEYNFVDVKDQLVLDSGKYNPFIIKSGLSIDLLLEQITVKAGYRIEGNIAEYLDQNLYFQLDYKF